MQVTRYASPITNSSLSPNQKQLGILWSLFHKDNQNHSTHSPKCKASLIIYQHNLTACASSMSAMLHPDRKSKLLQRNFPEGGQTDEQAREGTNLSFLCTLSLSEGIHNSSSSVLTISRSAHSRLLSASLAASPPASPPGRSPSAIPGRQAGREH